MNISNYEDAFKGANRMKIKIGDLIVSDDMEVDFEDITGSLTIETGVKFKAKNLKKVGGDLCIHSNATLNVDKLETIGGDLYIHSNATLPKLETIGGYLYIYSSATLSAPNLINKNDKTAKITCEKALTLSFKKNGLIKVDGILSWFISRKKIKDLIIFKIIIVGKLKISFVVQRNEQFAHGETIQKAIKSLRYKLTDRDTSKFRKWMVTTTISVDDAIHAYRAITGACEFGVKNFCESIEIPKNLTVSKVIELTDGKYGNQEFRKFFKVNRVL